MQNVNQKDERFGNIIESLWEIVDLNDSFLISSIEKLIITQMIKDMKNTINVIITIITKILLKKV